MAHPPWPPTERQLHPSGSISWSRADCNDADVTPDIKDAIKGGIVDDDDHGCTADWHGLTESR